MLNAYCDAVFCENGEELWDAFYRMSCYGFIERGVWEKFFNIAKSWVFDVEISPCISSPNKVSFNWFSLKSHVCLTHSPHSFGQACSEFLAGSVGQGNL